MCGRYTLMSQPDCRELERILDAVDQAYGEKGLKVKRGEIFPTSVAPILLKPEGDDCGGAITLEGDVEVKGELMVWGFPRPAFSKVQTAGRKPDSQRQTGGTGSGVVINARGETVQEKNMFRQSFASRRCIVPAGGFFEWSGKTAGRGRQAKEKYLFVENPGEPVYMAGIYNAFQAERRFVILTTAANESMKDIHDRMPILLSGGQLSEWLEDSRFAAALLGKIPPRLERKKAEEEGPRQLAWKF